MARRPHSWKDRLAALRVFRLVDREGMAPAARLERGNRRVRQVVGLIGLWVVFAYSAAVFAVMHVEDVRQYAEGNLMARTKIETRRGDIVDRNGVTLATSLRADSISADPRWVLPPGVKPSKMPFQSEEAKALRQKIGNLIADILGKPHEEIVAQLNRAKGFVYLARHIDAKASKALREAQARGKLPGITIQPEFVRYYPNNALAGALIGRDTTTGSIEGSFDALLRGQQVELRTYKDSASTQMYFDGAPEPGLFGGNNITLTIDEKIQAVAEHHLEAAVTEFQAKHGIAVVLDVQTSEVLALAQWPVFNPNDTRSEPKCSYYVTDPKSEPKCGYHDIALEFQFEPGSIFKVFNLAIGLEEKAVSTTEIIPTGAPFLVGNKVIKDDHPHPQVNWLQSLQVSSNIANAKIALRMEREVYAKYLKALGFGRRLDLGIIGEGAGQLAPSDKWSRIQFANIAFGQGISATPLQIVAGYAAIGNGGLWRRPRLIHDVISPDGKNDRHFQAEAGARVFSTETTQKVLQAMASVCQPRGENSLGGTGTAARMPNYSIGGKTGTAQQANGHGGYSDSAWVGSFVGVTPIEKPRLVVLAAIDTPTKYDPKLGKIARYGGIVAAPVVREIARFALPYLGVPPSPGAPYLDRNDADKARLLDEQRLAAARKSADQLVAQNQAAVLPPPAAAVDQPTLAQGLVRVPDLLRLPMRTARQTLARSGLGMEARGSGIGVTQGPLAGAIVRKGTIVQVAFKRLSEVAEAQPPVVGQL